MQSIIRVTLFAIYAFIPYSCGFNLVPPSAVILSTKYNTHNTYRTLSMSGNDDYQSSFMDDTDLFSDGIETTTRRNFFASIVSSAVMISSLPTSVNAEETRSTNSAVITDKIYIEFKGLSAPSEPNDRIVIGLFGNDSPQPVSILKQVVTPQGYKSKCKPLDTTRTFEKEQLEANKVYNNCIEKEDTVGVNYEYSTVWRVVNNERLDIGAVSGKFIAREPPNFEDKQSGLKHDEKGVVSVRRGNESGYGFTIFPGGNAQTLDQENVVVGRVIEGMDVVDKLNSIPVVKNTLAGNKKKTAPSRACRYGGNELFCNEQKPLKKVTLNKTGIL